METWLHRKMEYEGRIISVENGMVRMADGHEAPREVVRHPGAVGIIPFDGTDVILVRQYRIPVEDYVIEIPAGKIEPGDTPEQRARIELKEETGYTAGRWESAGSFFPSVGILDETVHLFLAFDLEPGEQALEEDEVIELRRMSLEDVREGLASRFFSDAKTIIGLQELIAHTG